MWLREWALVSSAVGAAVCYEDRVRRVMLGVGAAIALSNLRWLTRRWQLLPASAALVMTAVLPPESTPWRVSLVTLCAASAMLATLFPILKFPAAS